MTKRQPAKGGKEHAHVTAQTVSPAGRIPQAYPHGDKPIPGNIYPVIDNDLARDNIENDMPAADLEDL